MAAKRKNNASIRNTSTGREVFPIISDRTDIHPFSRKLNDLRQEIGWKKKELARYLGKSEEQIFRILHMKGNEQLPLELIKKIFDVFAPVSKSSFQGDTQNDYRQDIKWQWYIKEVRLDVIFFDLATALTKQNRGRNPSELIESIQDETRLQSSMYPEERWLITDILAESYDENLMVNTCKQIQDNLQLLAIFMPNNALKNFDRFLSGAKKFVQDESFLQHRIMCIAMPEYTFLFRIRLDDPQAGLGSPNKSAVISIGPPPKPLLLRLDEKTAGDIFVHFYRIVAAFRQKIDDAKKNAQQLQKVQRKFELEIDSDKTIPFYLHFPW
jgi:transcriptional regulator with XRE-family HTH domain